MKKKADGTLYTTLDLIRLILIKEMGLDSDRVNIFDQKFKIPPDDGLFITIEYKGTPKVIANRNIVVTTAYDFTEKQEIQTQEAIAISVFSRNLDALRRKEEIYMAIGSLYAQQMQETQSFKIARIAPMENLSGLEGAAMLYRFETSLVVFGWYEKIKAGDYYDTFNVELNTEKETVEISLN